MVQKSVTPKTASAPLKASASDAELFKSPATISTPLAAQALAAADDGFRVTPRTVQPGVLR